MKFCLRTLLVVTVLSIGGGGSAWSQDIAVSTRDSTPVSVSAGGVGTRMVSMTNLKADTSTVRLSLSLPASWSVLIPPAKHVIAGAEVVNELVSFQVPRNTLAGDYEIVLSSQNGAEISLGKSITMNVVVRPQFTVEAEWIEYDELVRAGSQISGVLVVTNSGNASAIWELDARSSLEYGVGLSAQRLVLQAGQSEQVDVSIDTSDEIVAPLTHSLVVRIARIDESAGGEAAMEDTDNSHNTVQITFATNMLPVKRSLASRRENTLPIRLSLVGATEENQQVGQVELSLPETIVGTRIYEALIRTPDVRKASAFASSDRYSLSVSSSKAEVYLGDQTFESSELLESGSLGFGAGTTVYAGRLSFGGYAQQSRQVFPKRKQAALFAHYQMRPSFRIEASALSKRSYEEGDAFSLAAQAEPGQSLIRAEYALGSFGGGDAGRERGDAIQVEANTSWKSSSFSLKAERADAAFLGSIQNTEGVSSSLVLGVTDWFRLEGQARGRRRHYDLADGSTATQSIGSARVGMRLIRSGDRNRVFLSVFGLGQINENTLSQLSRQEKAIEARFGLNKRRFGLSATAATGQTQDPVSPELDPNRRVNATLFGTKGGFSLNMSGSYTDGPTFYNPVNQERMTLGINAGWDSGQRTRINAGVFRSKDLSASNQQFTLANARIVHQFPFMHELSLRARVAQTDFDSSIRSATLGFTYSIPLYIKAPGVKRAGSELKGRVVNIETGEPISGAVLSLDAETVVTGEDGGFSFNISGDGTPYLSIDRQSIGFERRPVEAFPMAIFPEALGDVPLEIGVVRSSGLSATITLNRAAAQQRNSALSQELSESAVAGLVVEARQGATRIRRLTDRRGTAQFSDLLPGEWSIFAVGASLPSGYVTRPDTIHISLAPTSTEAVQLALSQKVRGIQLVSSGGVSLGKPAAAVSLVAQPPAEQAAQEIPTASSTDDEPADVAPVLTDDSVRLHRVLKGETLSVLARQYYRSTVHWIRIWQANAAVLPYPDILTPGTDLIIPTGGRLTPDEARALQLYEAGQQ